MRKKFMHSKKFFFYVNRCSECLETTELSLRPRTPTLCRTCRKKYNEMYQQAKKDILKEKQMTREAIKKNKGIN
jgi:hypothetical protein